MAYYQKHIFVCTNQKEGGKQCCQQAGAHDIWEYMKKKIGSLNLGGEGKIRVSRSGCLGRCKEGPVLVIYPEGVWYTYAKTNDIDEIIASHILGGQVVQRLLLDDKTQQN